MFCGLLFIYMVYYIDRLSFVEPSLNLWDKAYLVMVNNFLKRSFQELSFGLVLLRVMYSLIYDQIKRSWRNVFMELSIVLLCLILSDCDLLSEWLRLETLKTAYAGEAVEQGEHSSTAVFKEKTKKFCNTNQTLTFGLWVPTASNG
ncbi:hypothetical protein STEG23_034414, partial [Scotinomys teguina]